MSKHNLSFINADLFLVSDKLPSWMGGWMGGPQYLDV